jgi:hypothetical protein
MKSVEERFYEKVDKTGECWLWMGSLNRCGYGSFRVEGKQCLPHRLSLEWKLGRQIGAGMVARHKCRNRNCVNPEHLEEGTYAENEEDKIRDETVQRGIKNKSCKLSENQVRAIRVDTRSQIEIAIDYGVHQATVSLIKTGKNWSWLH